MSSKCMFTSVELIPLCLPYLHSHDDPTASSVLAHRLKEKKASLEVASGSATPSAAMARIENILDVTATLAIHGSFALINY